MLRNALASKSNTVFGGVLKSPGAGATLYGGGGADTIYGGGDAIYGGNHAILSRLRGAGNTVDTGAVADTVYGGMKADTVYGGGIADTIYAGSKAGFPGGGTMSGGGTRVVTATVVNPATRSPISVTYDRETGAYLDKSLKRWVLAPNWMASQIR